MILFVWFFFAFFLIHNYPFLYSIPIGIIATILTYGVTIALLFSYCKMINGNNIDQNKGFPLAIPVGIIAAIYAGLASPFLAKIPVGRVISMIVGRYYLSAFIFGFIATQVYTAVETNANYCS